MEVEVLDLSQKSSCEKENDIPTAMDLSQRPGSVICVSEDEEDESINELIAKINTENPSPDAIEACQKLLLQLDEKLRNEETIEILLAQMKMTQRRMTSTNGSVNVTRQNGIPAEVKNSNGCVELLTRVDAGGTHSPVNLGVGETTASLTRVCTQTTATGVTTSISTTVLDSAKAGVRMTREMAMQALDQQYMARKALLRKQADKSLSEIPLARPSQGALAQSDLNLVPSTTTNEFVALVGLEEVVKNLQEYRNVALGQKANDMKLVFNPFNCVQCGTDFTPLWKRERPGSSSVVCESCCGHNYRKAVQKDYQEKIKLVLKKYQDQERDLDRDYKDMLDSPKKFELFRKEQEKKLLAMSSSTSRASVSNSQHNPTAVRSTSGHHHQTVISTPVVGQQAARTVHRAAVTSTNNVGGSRPTTTTGGGGSSAGASQQYGQQPLRHQNSSNGAISTGSGAATPQLTVDQLAYMQMFQALNQLGSSANMNPQASRQQQQLMQQILQMAYMSSASTLLGGSSNTAAANSFVQLLSNMAGLVGSNSPSGVVEPSGAAAAASVGANSSANNTILNYYLSILQQQQQQQQASGNSDK